MTTTSNDDNGDKGRHDEEDGSDINDSPSDHLRIENSELPSSFHKNPKPKNILKPKASKTNKQEPETEMRNRESLFMSKPKNTRIAGTTVILTRKRKKQAQKTQNKHKQNKHKKSKTRTTLRPIQQTHGLNKSKPKRYNKKTSITKTLPHKQSKTNKDKQKQTKTKPKNKK